MENKVQGLTGKYVYIRGLLGRKPRLDYTQSGKLRAYYDLGTGINDAENLKYVTWNHCFSYGDKSEILKHASVGDLVHVKGWSATEAQRNELGQPVIENEKIVKVEYNICFSVELIPRGQWKNQTNIDTGQLVLDNSMFGKI